MLGIFRSLRYLRLLKHLSIGYPIANRWLWYPTSTLTRSSKGLSLTRSSSFVNKIDSSCSSSRLRASASATWSGPVQEIIAA